jgi:hypothetical protein
MFASRRTTAADDLHFALKTLDESSHLGLDSEYALKIRAAILRQIERNGPALSAAQASPHSIENPKAA